MSVKPLDAEDTFYCKVCNLNIPDFELHVAGKYHKLELADYDDTEHKSDNNVDDSDWNDPDIEKIDVMSIDDDSSKGYILGVDLEYPKELHVLHNDFPLPPESIELDGVQKLVPNFQNKIKYVIHYRALKQCLRFGLKLTKIHRILKFDQRPWMKSYIDLNTAMRKKVENDFERNFCKFMNNSVFGKTMENISRVE